MTTTTTTSLAGKTILITGGTRGLGAATTRALARLGPSKIYITGRPSSSATASALISSILSEVSSHPNICKDIVFLPTDHSSLSSIASTANHLLKTENKLDILICNAGIAAVPLSFSADGYESQFATNFLSHALLIKKLLPLLRSSSSTLVGGANRARIISLGTFGYRLASTISFPSLSGPGLAAEKDDWLGMAKWRRYAESKLAIVLYTQELARREQGVTSVVVSPGFVESDMLRGFGRVDYWVTKLGAWLVPGQTQRGVVSVEEGAGNVVWGATVGLTSTHGEEGERNGEGKEGKEEGKQGLVSGGYYDPVGMLVREEEMSKASRDRELAGKLWEWTEGELGKWF